VKDIEKKSKGFVVQFHGGVQLLINLPVPERPEHLSTFEHFTPTNIPTNNINNKEHTLNINTKTDRATYNPPPPRTIPFYIFSGVGIGLRYLPTLYYDRVLVLGVPLQTISIMR